ncbi:MAG: DUF4270 domain-containing protein [Aquaticitalea sp.]
MNKIKFALKNGAILALLIGSFVACDKDYATIGSDIIGGNNFDVESTKEYSVVAYTNPLTPLKSVQTNGLPINYLGAYNDETYGLTTASFVSQMGISYEPDFGDDVKMDSVVLTIPYFSTRTSITDEGETIYSLDSIFGDGRINIELFENKFFLNTVDPNSEFDMPLAYYSNMSTANNTISTALLEGEPIPLAASDVNSLTNFKPSADEIQLWDTDDEITERLTPSLRVKLDTTYFRSKIIDMQANDPTVLSNANNFNNYFRGIYFKTTAIDNDGSLALLNFSSTAANITIYYTKESTTSGADRVESTYAMTFSGNKVNFLTNQFDFTIPQGDPITGDPRLYLKGGEGSVAVIDLFKGETNEDGFSPEFMDFKNAFVDTDADGKFVKAKRLINEANLVFFVDQNMVEGNEPDRIFLYDLTNNEPLVDFIYDVANTTSPNSSIVNHLGVLEREGDVSTGDGIKYKIRITEHIKNLLLRDSTNVKLGLSVSANVNLESGLNQLKVRTADTDIVNKVPVSSILSPRGTILYGNNTVDEQKKLYLEIFYTEPNN